jgi:hypothetical protein
MQAIHIAGCQGVQPGEWMDAGAPQDFVHDQVPGPGDQALVHERGLDPPTPSPHQLLKPSPVHR